MTYNDEPKALFPEARCGCPKSECPVCGHISSKILYTYLLIYPYEAKVLRFACVNSKCTGKMKISRALAKKPREWDVEEKLEGVRKLE